MRNSRAGECWLLKLKAYWGNFLAFLAVEIIKFFSVSNMLLERKKEKVPCIGVDRSGFI